MKEFKVVLACSRLAFVAWCCLAILYGLLELWQYSGTVPAVVALGVTVILYIVCIQMPNRIACTKLPLVGWLCLAFLYDFVTLWVNHGKEITVIAFGMTAFLHMASGIDIHYHKQENLSQKG